MKFKRIAIVFIAITAIGGFGYLGVKDATKTKNLDSIQKVEVKSRETEIQELNVKYDKLNNEQEKALKEKGDNQAEVERLKQEKIELDKQKQELEKQLQAKKDEKSRLALASEKAINTATGTQTASAQSGSGDVKAIIKAAANKYGVSESYMLAMAHCESTTTPTKVNPQPVIVRGVNHGHAAGLYQFIPSTWARMSSQAGFGGADVFNAYANANTFAWAISTGHAGEWECKR